MTTGPAYRPPDWLRRRLAPPPRARVAGAAVAAVAALGFGYWSALEFHTPYLANLAIDASSSVLSPGGLSTLMEFVGELGKAATFAGVLALQFALYVLIWSTAAPDGRLRGSRLRRDLAARVTIASLVVLAIAGFLALAADSPPLRGAEWAEFALHTFVEALAFALVASTLALASPALSEARERLRSPRSPLASDPAEGAADVPAAAAPATTTATAATAAAQGLFSRRQFLHVAWIMGAGTASLAAAWYLGRSVAATARTGVLAALDGLWSPEVTPTEDFYVVSKNIEGFDPDVALADWSLRVEGLTQDPRTFTLDDLQAMPATTNHNTLMCISYRVGGKLISNAEWTGVALRDILAAAGLDLEADPNGRFLKFTSADDYTESLPLASALDPDVRLVWLMNGEPLTRKHGFPLRALVPGRYGMKNPKWITQLSVQADEPTGYWAARGWSRDAFIRTMSRFDVPGRNDTIPPGRQPLRGVAFSGTSGISRVEVSSDGGETWDDARVHPPLSDFTWQRWEYDFDAAVPRHVLYVRATDGRGVAQIAQAADPLPEGATGLHRRPVSVRAPEPPAAS